MHKPMATLLSVLEDGEKEDRLIAYFHHLVKDLNRMTIEVVCIFEDFFKEKEIPLERVYPRLHKLLEEKRAAHRRSMAQVETALKVLNRG